MYPAEGVRGLMPPTHCILHCEYNHVGLKVINRTKLGCDCSSTSLVLVVRLQFLFASFDGRRKLQRKQQQLE